MLALSYDLLKIGPLFSLFNLTWFLCSNLMEFGAYTVRESGVIIRCWLEIKKLWVLDFWSGQKHVAAFGKIFMRAL